MKRAQDRPVILCPLEAVGARSCGEDTGKWDEAGIGCHQRFARRQHPFFEHANQGGLPDSARTDHHILESFKFAFTLNWAFHTRNIRYTEPAKSSKRLDVSMIRLSVRERKCTTKP